MMSSYLIRSEIQGKITGPCNIGHSARDIRQTHWTIKISQGQMWVRHFGDFRSGALLFMVIHVIYKCKNR